MVAKEALAQPISAWPCIRDLNLPPKKRVPFFFSEKDYDASSSVIYNLYGDIIMSHICFQYPNKLFHNVECVFSIFYDDVLGKNCERIKRFYLNKSKLLDYFK